MMGGIKPHYDCIQAFSETDFTEDLKRIDEPTLVMHGFGHGLCTINTDSINADLLVFIQS
jgi:non-heme chloroperoxidase